MAEENLRAKRSTKVGLLCREKLSGDLRSRERSRRPYGSGSSGSVHLYTPLFICAPYGFISTFTEKSIRYEHRVETLPATCHAEHGRDIRCSPIFTIDYAHRRSTPQRRSSDAARDTVGSSPAPCGRRCGWRRGGRAWSQWLRPTSSPARGWGAAAFASTSPPQVSRGGGLGQNACIRFSFTSGQPPIHEQTSSRPYTAHLSPSDRARS
jgi:hypothetical protein